MTEDVKGLCERLRDPDIYRPWFLIAPILTQAADALEALAKERDELKEQYDALEEHFNHALDAAGSSVFQSKPLACFIDDIVAERDAALTDLHGERSLSSSLNDMNKRLRKENEALRGALEPFADASYSDSGMTTQDRFATLSQSHLDAARKALQEKP